MNLPTVAVLDYGSGNLRSAERALARARADVVVTGDLEVARNVDGLVVPGVGAYAACMAGVEAIAAGPMIADRLSRRPDRCSASAWACRSSSSTARSTASSRRASDSSAVASPASTPYACRTWGGTRSGFRRRPPLFAGAAVTDRYYFVHSYAATATDAGALVTTAAHDTPFIAAVESGPLTATQFHPEKSGDAGARLLRNWVKSLRTP